MDPTSVAADPFSERDGSWVQAQAIRTARGDLEQATLPARMERRWAARPTGARLFAGRRTGRDAGALMVGRYHQFVSRAPRQESGPRRPHGLTAVQRYRR
jgi:hypothetical protein